VKFRFVSQWFLDRANAITRFEQVCGKRMAEGVAFDMLDQANLANRFLSGALRNRFMNMMPPFFEGQPDRHFFGFSLFLHHWTALYSSG
jgi:hypothetical protein